VPAGILISDRRLRSPPCRVIDQHGSGLGDRLQPGRRIDGVAQHHPFSFGAHFDCRVTSKHPGSQAELRHAHFLGQRGDSLDQSERRADGSLGVILARDGRPPNRHHGIADELFHSAAVALDNHAAAVEILAQQLPYLLGVTMLAERGEAHEVGKQHGDEAALRDGLGRGRKYRRGPGERRCTLHAKASTSDDRCAAVRAGLLYRRRAVDAEAACRGRQLAAVSALHLLSCAQATTSLVSPIRSSQRVAPSSS
jgi:hypothetical protein